jgi:hypothetical protein
MKRCAAATFEPDPPVAARTGRLAISRRGISDRFRIGFAGTRDREGVPAPGAACPPAYRGFRYGDARTARARDSKSCRRGV